MSPLKTAVVGVGYLGRFHAQKYAALESSELVGVCDVSEEVGQAVAKELGVEFFKDHRDLVEQVDAVTIASSTTTHFELAKFFLENGIHVHVEKPMTTTSDEGRALCDLAEKKNLNLQVGHVERFNPALLSAQEKLQLPLFIECHRLAPFNMRGTDVNVVLDLMIHDIDVVLSLVKSPVKAVSAVGTPVITQTIDIANARVEFETGTVANITASRVSMNSQRKFRVFQNNQYLSLDFGSGRIDLHTKTGEWNEGDLPPVESDTWNLEKGDALLAETQSFIESIQAKTPPVVSGRDGLVALELAEQIIAKIDQRNS